MTSARTIKRKTKLALRQFMAVSEYSNRGDISVYLPNRRWPIVLTRKEAQIMQAVLALPYPHPTTGNVISPNLFPE